MKEGGRGPHRAKSEKERQRQERKRRRGGPECKQSEVLNREDVSAGGEEATARVSIGVGVRTPLRVEADCREIGAPPDDKVSRKLR